jgi:hypothetical protein
MIDFLNANLIIHEAIGLQRGNPNFKQGKYTFTFHRSSMEANATLQALLTPQKPTRLPQTSMDNTKLSQLPQPAMAPPRSRIDADDSHRRSLLNF